MSPVVVPIHAKTNTGPKYTGQDLYEAWESTRPNRETTPSVYWGVIKPKHQARWEALAAIVNERINSQPYEIEQLIERFMTGIQERLGRNPELDKEFTDPTYVKPQDPGTSPPPFRRDEDIVQAANDFLLVNKRSEQLGTNEMIDELRRRGYGIFRNRAPGDNVGSPGNPNARYNPGISSESHIGKTSGSGHVFNDGGLITANESVDADRFVAENDVAVEGPDSAEPQVNTYAEEKPETKAQVTELDALKAKLAEYEKAHSPRTTPPNPQVDTDAPEAKSEEKIKDSPTERNQDAESLLGQSIEALFDYAEEALKLSIDSSVSVPGRAFYLRMARKAIQHIRKEL
jgi:hypothetical protein